MKLSYQKVKIRMILSLLFLITLLIGGGVFNTIFLIDFQIFTPFLISPQEKLMNPLQNSVEEPLMTEEVEFSLSQLSSLSYSEHAPIYINGNTNFNATAIAEGWSGNGTVTNPYIIENLNITGPAGSNLIEIQHTDMYFQISNCFLSNGAWAIFLNFVKHGFIFHNTIIFNNYGVWIEFSDNNTFSANNISLNTGGGIWMDTAVNNTISHNIFFNNQYGLQLTSAPNSTLLNNTISSSTRQGMAITSSGNLRMVDNRFFNSGIDISGSQVTDLLQLEVFNNSVNNKPLIYWQQVNGGIIPHGVGEVILIDCQSITVTGLNLSASTVGLTLILSKNCTVHNNTFSNNRRGIRLLYSNDNTFYNNTFLENNYAGMYLLNSGGNSFYNNNISFNGYGIFLDYIETTGNKFYANVISNNMFGIYVLGTSNNIFIGNIIFDNTNYGISLSFSKNNLILWNEFINNFVGGSSQASDTDNLAVTNLFDYNYWNDWILPDLNNDGVIDTPYSITGSSNNQDFHPLVYLPHFTPPIIQAPNEIEVFSGNVTISWFPSIDKWGHKVFYTLYYSNDNGTSWNLLISNIEDTSFQWDTTSVPDGTEYLIKVEATCSANITLTDITDNTFTIQNSITLPPDPPQGLTAVAGELFVYLSWMEPSYDGSSPVTGYRVYRGLSSGKYSLIFITSETSLNDTLVTGDITYYYVVTAVNSVGESTSSLEVTGTPLPSTSHSSTTITTTITSTTINTSSNSGSTSMSTTTQAQPGSFPQFYVVVLFLCSLSIYKRKWKRS